MDEVIPVYQVGDIVRVVEVPNRHAYAGWADEMDEYCGVKTRIADRWTSSNAPGGYAYEIMADDREWTWSADCFEVPVQVEDIDPAASNQGIDELFSMFGGV